jgi:hypothetical protein
MKVDLVALCDDWDVDGSDSGKFTITTNSLKSP